ncbi:hypothetical protein BD408DRAFT_409916 [Parasitella parasitica]|nr:hypothetical protein BD408DRAFT_409916 [Parasitella parasitica]
MKALTILIIFYAIHAAFCVFIPDELEKKVRTELTDRSVVNYNGQEGANQLIISENGVRKIPANGSDDGARDPLPDKEPRSDAEIIGIALLGALIGGTGGFFAAPFMIWIGLVLLGFTVLGVALGSFGAWLMSLYGGSIAAGSLVSTLQSMGALGLLNLFSGALPPLGAAFGIAIAEFVVFKYII